MIKSVGKVSLSLGLLTVSGMKFNEAYVESYLKTIDI